MGKSKGYREEKEEIGTEAGYSGNILMSDA
jgi:hypothetical protein